MKYLSLFSGVGGFELGIQQAYVEINRLCNSGKFTPVGGQDCSCGKGNLLQSGRRKTGRRRDIKGGDTVSAKKLNGLSLEENNCPCGVEINREVDTEGNSADSQGGDKERRQRATCVGYSEIDKYAVSIYQKHFPEHKNYGDITKINETELPDFDLLVGGFPCQSFSIAGKRGGFADTRGTMFFEIARILKAKQPRLLLLENVKGLLSHDEGRTFATIIATLDELGYDLQWQVLNSKNFGVPQNRERVFIVGHLRGTRRPQVFPFGEGRSVSVEERMDSTPSISALTATDYKGPSKQRPNLVVPTIQQLNQPKHSNDRVYGTEGISPTLNTMQGGNRQPKILAHYGHKNKEAVEMKISPTLKAQSHGHEPMVALNLETGYNGSYANAQETRPNKVLSSMQEVDSETPLQQRGANESTSFQENEVLQSRVYEKSVQRVVSDGRPQVDDCSLPCETDIQEVGNMRGVSQKEEDGDSSQERRLEGQHASESTGDLSRLPHETASNRKTKDNVQESQQGQSWKVRRLTPKEAERLQSFPDNWTAFGADGKPISDSQRYKCLGNAVTVNVIREIMKNLL